MKIARITLEGFKSYGQRVTIDGFHHGFNAITGPNGTGKSNIFDGILFAMGFRPGSQMRVNSLDELIFKRGQAGVTSAAVTIEFDNTDRTTSPPMYVDQKTITVTRQIAIGGRDRQFVNGHVKKLKEVHRLFSDARLSIEQPQFLVMQGRVTKVVNMKPLEVLEFFQEAVGTSIFDKERRGSERILQDKQQQLARIEHDIKHNFEPVLLHLRQEKENYSKWIQLGEYLPCVRHLWTCRKKLELEATLETIHKSVASGREELIRLEKKSVELSNKMQSLADERQRAQITKDESMKDKKFAALEAELQPVQRAIAVAEDIVQELTKAIAGKKKAIATKQREREKIETTLATFEAKNQEPLERAARAEARKNQVQSDLDILTKRIDGIKNGDLVDESGTSLANVLRDKEQRFRDLDAQLHSLAKRKELANGIITDLGSRVKGKGELPKLQKDLAEYEKQAAGLQAKIAKMEFDPQAHDETMRAIASIISDLKVLHHKIKELEETQFRDTLAYRGLVPSHGDFAGQALELFYVKESHQKFCVALEETGKGKLRHLVVKDDNVAQQIFQKAAKLGRRVTCAPLAQLRSKPLAPGMVRKAKEFGADPTDVVDPLECIEVENENLMPAMHYVFSSAFLCTHRDTAERMVADPRWSVPAITIDGERWESSGAMIGGSTKNLGQLIAAAQRLKNMQRERDQKQALLTELKAKYATSQSVATAFERANEELARINTSLNSTKEKISRARELTDEGRLANAKDDLINLEESVKAAQGEQKELQVWIQSNKRNIEGFDKDKELTRLGKLRTKYIADVKKAEEELAATFRDAESVRAQQAQLMTAKEMLESEVEKIETEEIPAMEKQIEDKNKEIEINAEKRSQLEKNLEAEMEQRRVLEARIVQLDDEKEAAKIELNQNERDIKTLQQNIAGAKQQKGPTEKALALASEEVEKLPPVDPKVVAEVQLKYEAASVAELKAEIDELGRQRGKLQMRIDKKAVEALNEAEEKFKELSRDRLEAERSRDAVVKYIENIDLQKRQTLETAFTKVDNAFGQIFSTLLPGASSRLVLVNNQDLNKGIEMAVSLQPRSNKTTNLAALSGGQKSLLSLALIFAFLKLNPSPFYILDEVDAALDLSHTQNLGLMIKRYFPESQFVVVSHKDNLYSNADVLFKTAFVNGKSSVSHHRNTETH